MTWTGALPSKSTFIANVATLASGTAFAQLIGIGAMLVLTRLYDAAAFGAYAAFSSTVLLLSVVAALRYEQAVMLPRSDYGALVVARLALRVSLVVCGLALLIFLLGYQQLDALYNVALGRLWILVPILAALVAAFQTLNLLANRRGGFEITAVARTGKAMGLAGTQIAAGFAGLVSGAGLILGEFAGLILGLGLNLKGLAGHEGLRKAGGSGKRNSRALRAAALRYQEFPKINAPHALINQLQNWLTIFIIGALFAAQELGAYFLMYRVVMFPAALIGAAVGQVYYRQAVAAARVEGALFKLVGRMVLILGAFGITIGLVLFFAGEPLFAFVFGQQWARAGVFASLLAPYVALQFILAPLAYTAMVTSRQRTAFALSVIQNIVFVGAFWLGARFLGGIESGIGAAALAVSIYMSGMIAWNMLIARNPRQLEPRQHRTAGRGAIDTAT